MTLKASLGALSLALTLALPAHALTQREIAQCNALSRTLPGKQAEVLRLKELQAELAAEAETAGEAWELAEETRRFSPAHAEAADTARAAFDTAQDEAMRVTTDLQSKAQMLNADVASFNSKCVRN